ncbi:MAG: mechanosensitive ion channel domain-containing protein, partial [Pirellulales bacterium]
MFRRLLDPKKGVTAAVLVNRPGGLLARLVWLWRPFVVAMPLLLAGLSLSGYAFAATELTVSLYKSIWTIVGAAIFQGVAMRWLLVSKRRIALQQLKERSALREQAEAAGAASEMLHVNQMKLSAIDQQTRRLIDAVIVVGVFGTLFWIWSPVLPALSFLDSVVLWEMRAADGTVTSVVALSNVLVAIPTLLLTFVVVHNVPGLLEAALLRRLPLDNASRYAITTLTSYLLALCGMLLAAGTLGLRWSSVQWLAAGLSVGLGFGLQEVVANFVCGLILLFEQPIRVGDVVTLDTITGVVSRIRIRATTVTTWERQEYVIPNKDLITGRVINWTLSDSVNRAELTVGVAYGTDTRRVIELLREICSGIPDILTDPAPIITFEQFGDSTLNLVVRFYLASLDNRLGTISELHSQIHERFNAAGIEIAFPQIDVHVKPEPPA